MKWEQIKSQWKQLSGDVKKQWAELTDDEIAEIEGSREKLIGKLQSKYGKAKDQVENEIKEWEEKLKSATK